MAKHGLFQGCMLIQQFKKSMLTHHINRLTKKVHMILSVDTEKAFYKFKNPFMILTLRKIWKEAIFLNLKKEQLQNSKFTAYLRTKDWPLCPENKTLKETRMSALATSM